MVGLVFNYFNKQQMLMIIFIWLVLSHMSSYMVNILSVLALKFKEVFKNSQSTMGDLAVSFTDDR